MSYYENVQKQQEADRARWAQEQADAPLTELHVAGAIEWSWKNLPELFQLAIYGTIAGAIFAAEVGNGTVLILSLIHISMPFRLRPHRAAVSTPRPQSGSPKMPRQRSAAGASAGERLPGRSRARECIDD